MMETELIKVAIDCEGGKQEFTGMRHLPNILSFLRILLIPLFLWLYFQDAVLIRFVGILIFAIAALTDLLDGYIARKKGFQTPFGTFLDPLADKLLTFSGFVCLPFIDTELYPWWAIWAIVVRDLVITGLRLYAKQVHQPLYTRSSAKWKTFAQMTFLYIALILGATVESTHPLLMFSGAIMSSWAMYYALLFVTILTLYSGLEYLVVNRALFYSRRPEAN